ncbi:glycosyltransferase family 2 protein [Cohnella abietis]|uniref:Glycosyltransferase 2-like domain-containing protein n=1 Tax=Cohnella abietis TaxID=2507935 RepID=A0A3T1DDR6_9BACL|nr:glycosyltransferase family 2 protein [Cohnella abietis]BBI36174.1 hypothetical protein KCTCHS21_55730 [Cohnella abietis]
MEQSRQLTHRKPSVSVIVPNLNQGQFLEEALQSILNQPNLDIRIAVMDAGSRDESVSIIHKYESQLTYWRSERDEGQAAAINEGVKKLPNSDYICWLNADDVFLENGLTKMVQFLESHPNDVAVYSKAYITNVLNEVIEPYETEPFSVERLAHHCFICQPATLIRGKIWNELNGLNAELQMCLDYDLWWRLSKSGVFGYLSEFTACSRDHEATKTRNNKETHFNEAFQLLKNYTGRVPLNWCLSRAAEKQIQAPYVMRKILEKAWASYMYIKYRF